MPFDDTKAARIRCPTCHGSRYLNVYRGGIRWTRKCRRCHGEAYIKAHEDPQDVKVNLERRYKKRKEPPIIIYGRKLQFF